MFTPQLNVVVGFAQKWADHLAKTGSFQHNQDRNFEKQTLGENIAMKWTSNNDAFTGDVSRLPPEDGDRIMLEHLEPWRGQRQRVMRLLMVAGVSRPRRAAKRANPAIRRL